MTKTFQLAMKKASQMSESIQDEIGMEILERVDTSAWLRHEIELGIRDLDAGRRVQIDAGAFIKEVRRRHGRKKT